MIYNPPLAQNVSSIPAQGLGIRAEAIMGFRCVLLVCSHLLKHPRFKGGVPHLQGSESLPDIVVTSYHMLQNLSCEACKAGKLEGCLGPLVRTRHSMT